SYTAPLVVERDPRFPDEARGEEGDAQEELALRLREYISRLSGIVKQVRALRKQLDLQAELMADADQPEARKLREQGEALAGKLKELERKLHNPDAEVTYDIFAREGGAMLYSQFVALLSFVTAAEGEPTQGMRRVARELGAELAQYEKEFAVLRANEAAAFNAFAREHGLPPLWLPGGDGGAAAPAKAASP
ncbi:MAG TPA: hypothetical protein VIL46_10970, partial [Gemmataceae bacterium]